ncbi:MAG: ABC transporter, substrate-binding protein (cluster 10, nitrate/sulfonate/bicarbonate), partial [uncultured Acidimicrobiales bacterium]
AVNPPLPRCRPARTGAGPRRLRCGRGQRTDIQGRGRRLPGDPEARVLPERHARDSARRDREGHLRPGARAGQAGRADLQRRARRCRGPVRRRPGRHLHRPQPGDQRVLQVRRRCHPDHLRGHLRRCVPGRQAERHPASRPEGQEGRQPAAGRNPGRGPASMARRPGPEARHPGRHLGPPPGERPDAGDVQGRRHRGRVGAGALGHPPGPGGWWQGPRRREVAVAQRAVRDHPPRRSHEVPQGAPGDGQTAPPGAGGGQRLRQREHRRGPAPDQPGHREDHRQEAVGRGHHRVVGEPHLHQRPRGELAHQVSRRRRTGGPAEEGRPGRDLRPVEPPGGAEGRGQGAGARLM